MLMLIIGEMGPNLCQGYRINKEILVDLRAAGLVIWVERFEFS
jgi:hypothetical protein